MAEILYWLDKKSEDKVDEIGLGTDCEDRKLEAVG